MAHGGGFGSITKCVDFICIPVQCVVCSVVEIAVLSFIATAYTRDEVGMLLYNCFDNF